MAARPRHSQSAATNRLRASNFSSELAISLGSKSSSISLSTKKWQLARMPSKSMERYFERSRSAKIAAASPGGFDTAPSIVNEQGAYDVANARKASQSCRVMFLMERSM